MAARLVLLSRLAREPFPRCTARAANRLVIGSRAVLHDRRPAGLGGGGADDSVVEPEEEEGRRPLADEQGPVVFLGELEASRDQD